MTVHIDPRVLAPPCLQEGRLLFNVEGHGRSWLGIGTERGDSSAGPHVSAEPVQQGE